MRPTVERDIAAPAAVVWDLLVDVRRWPAWGPTVRAVELDGAGPRIECGSRGHVVTPLGVRLPFVITMFEDGRCWSWRVRGVPATDHSVVSTSAGCRASFSVPWWATPYLAVGVVALRRIDDLATSGR